MQPHKALQSDFDNRGRIILIVQESELEATETANAIHGFGHGVDCVQNPLTAIQRLSETRFDGVVLDWPYAKNLLHYLRTERRFVPMPVVVLLDDPSSRELVFDAYEHGSDLALVKPVKPGMWSIFTKL